MAKEEMLQVPALPHGLRLEGREKLSITGVQDVSGFDEGTVLLETGEDRSGMFFAARTFAFKMGQAIAMVVFTSITALRPGMTEVLPAQYRTTAVVATVTCLIGASLFLLYNEKMILSRIEELKKRS